MSVKKRAQLVALLLAAWTVPAVLGSLQIYAQLQSRDVDANWLRLFLGQLSLWYLWAFFTPFLFRLPARWPLDAGRWRSSVPLLLLISLMVVAVYSAIFTAIIIPSEGRALTVESYFNALGASVLSRLTTNILLVWALIGLAYARLYWRQWRERELHATELQAQLAKAQLQTVRAQLHPHFLFNSLHAVGGLIRQKDEQGALRTLSALSDLLRYSLDRIDRQEVSLEEELEGLERYLEIAEVRFGDRLQVERDIDSKTLDAMVPTLILQPVVENAMRHGIGADPSAGHVGIGARVENDRLILTVTDDGPGPMSVAESTGLGLRSTRQRLNTLYGEQQSVSLEPRTPKGTVVTLTVPYRATS